ncbi:hypothetical protein AWL63_23355 (plasmid) [Sphingomonas panacis]|uniref:Uncharacterized protein n=1 Tax=Sphingomonas panacis TaxID=1560345 RepID=A0A1B3ZI56_9SPHN|nr:hypothetical protein [Sphingomonas panacis]AOH87115.1 hypothetical protein AWL63_23355 [Sphingomonas panacis]
MVRRLISLLLAIALLGVTGQSAAYAAHGPDPMQSAHMSMDMADCMKMMEQAAPNKATKSGKHKGCTPADCLNFMISCAGIAAALPNDPTPSLVAYNRRAILRPSLADPLQGRSQPPDIQPPIA